MLASCPAVVDNLLSKEDLVSMDRGCVCCSLRNDIVGALRELQVRAAAALPAAPPACSAGLLSQHAVTAVLR